MTTMRYLAATITTPRLQEISLWLLPDGWWIIGSGLDANTQRGPMRRRPNAVRAYLKEVGAAVERAAVEASRRTAERAAVEQDPK